MAAALGLELDARGLSTGQKQLVNIAAGLLADPCAFLMDEPTSHLDWLNKRMVNEAVKKLGKPVLYVTHDPLEAAYLADKICVMKNGKIIQCIEDKPDLKELEKYASLIAQLL